MSGSLPRRGTSQSYRHSPSIPSSSMTRRTELSPGSAAGGRGPFRASEAAISGWRWPPGTGSGEDQDLTRSTISGSLGNPIR